MRIKILGTGTSIPSLKRGSSSYVVHGAGKTILIDAGPAVVRRLLEFGYVVDDIDILIITHFHVDHTADLSTFLFACNYGLTAREKPLSLIGGQGMHKFFRGLKAVYPWLAPKHYLLTVKSLPSGSIEEDGLRIETKKMNHNRESIGVTLIVDGTRCVITGDTDYSSNLVSLARDAKLLIAECAFPEKKVKGHMNLETLKRVVGEAKPQRVILTHLYPDWDDFRGILHAPLLLGEDGLEIRL
ncbi:MAG TPA: ribonuclease Z [Syntrophorhabdaceae bacterium]